MRGQGQAGGGQRGMGVVEDARQVGGGQQDKRGEKIGVTHQRDKSVRVGGMQNGGK